MSTLRESSTIKETRLSSRGRRNLGMPPKKQINEFMPARATEMQFRARDDCIIRGFNKRSIRETLYGVYTDATGGARARKNRHGNGRRHGIGRKGHVVEKDAAVLSALLRVLFGRLNRKLVTASVKLLEPLHMPPSLARGVCFGGVLCASPAEFHSFTIRSSSAEVGPQIISN
jgi:hypothetical protein